MCAFAAAATLEISTWAAGVQPSVVMLEMHDVYGNLAGNGTGFVVTAEGRVATNEHVAVVEPDIAVFADGTRRAVLGVVAENVRGAPRHGQGMREDADSVRRNP